MEMTGSEFAVGTDRIVAKGKKTTIVETQTYREVRVPDPERRPEERWEGWEADRDAGLLVRAGGQGAQEGDHESQHSVSPCCAVAV